jgi:pimeloyl-ACP methyl ester carboxylesterase
MHQHDGLVDGFRLHWLECGSGPPVALVHGIGVSGRYFVPLARRLAATHRVLVPDLPGFGHSPAPPRRLRIGGYADLLAAWLETIAIASVPLVANSFGCQLVTELAVRRPERASSLVLIGPTIDRHARSFGRQLWRLALDIPREPPSLWPLIARDYAVFMAKGGLPLIGEMLRDRVEERLPDVRVPALVLRGSRDPIVTQLWAEEVASRLPLGELRVVEGFAHDVHYASPGDVADIVLDFLAR